MTSELWGEERRATHEFLKPPWVSVAWVSSSVMGTILQARLRTISKGLGEWSHMPAQGCESKWLKVAGLWGVWSRGARNKEWEGSWAIFSGLQNTRLAMK